MTQHDEIESFAVTGAIAQTLQRYVDGARTGDIALLRSAFAEGARVSGSYGGRPVNWSLDEFCDAVAKGGPAPRLEARIVAIDPPAGGDGPAGSARLARHALHGFLRDVPAEDDWIIDSKVFHAHTRA